MLTSNVVSSFCDGSRGRLRTPRSGICKICVNTDWKHEFHFRSVSLKTFSTAFVLSILHWWLTFPVLNVQDYFSTIHPLCQISQQPHFIILFMQLQQQEVCGLTYVKWQYLCREMQSTTSFSGSPQCWL